MKDKGLLDLRTWERVEVTERIMRFKMSRKIINPVQR